MREVARDAGRVAVITALARVVGFARWFVFAWAVGSTGVGGVYQTVNTVPNIVYEIAAGGILAAVVVPLVAARISTRAAEGPDEVASALLTRTLAVLVPLSIVLVVAAPWISRALLGDLEDEVEGAVALGTRLLLVFSPQIVLYGIGIVVAGVLQAHRRFVAAALAPLLSSLVVMATYVVWALTVPRSTVPSQVTVGEWLLLGGGTTLGVATLSLPLLVVAFRAGIRLRPRWRLAPETAARAKALAGAGISALLAQQVLVLVTLKVANRSGGDGTLVVQTYVQALYLLPYAVLAVPVATAVFPVLVTGVTSHDGGDREGAVRTLAGSLRAVVVLTGAAVAGMIAAAEPVGVVFAAVDRDGGAEALQSMPLAIAMMVPGLIGFAIAAVALRALYARGRAVRGGVIMALGWLTAAAIPLVLLGAGDGPRRTLAVLAVASSVGMWVAALGLLAQVRADWGVAALSRVPGAAGLVLVAVLAGSLVHLLAAGRWPLAPLTAALAGAGVALAVGALTVAVGAALDPAVRARLPGLRRLRTGSGR